MEKGFENIFKTLLKIENARFTELKLEGNKFSFKYGGGEFLFVRSLSPDLQTGYLHLFHSTPFDDERNLIEVDGFLIKVTHFVGHYSYKLTNHLNLSSNRFGLHPDEENYFTISLEDLPYYFAVQLIQKLTNEDFKIYLK